MKRQDESKLAFYSNLPFILPAGVAFYKSLPLYGALMLLATAVSLVHHWYEVWLVKVTDQFLALSVIAANLYVLYLSGFRQPHFALALLWVGIAFYFFFTGKGEKYDLYHALWHISSVMITLTLLCVVAY